jgi:acyl-CoA thioesterase-1
MKKGNVKLWAAIALALFSVACLGVAKRWRERLSVETTIVALGDSITFGARQGVDAQDAFPYLLQTELRKRGVDVHLVNAGIPGERTDQGIQRFDQAVLARAPRIVLIMYGTNDSYVYQESHGSDLPVETFAANLEHMIARARDAGVVPILLTAPRWGDQAKPDGAGHNPNDSLAKFARSGRDVAERTHTLLVDVYDHWQNAASAGVDTDRWTTDHCHPNPRGHREIADQILPAVLDALRDLPPTRPAARVTRSDDVPPRPASE